MCGVRIKGHKRDVLRCAEPQVTRGMRTPFGTDAGSGREGKRGEAKRSLRPFRRLGSAKSTPQQLSADPPISPSHPPPPRRPPDPRPCTESSRANTSERCAHSKGRSRKRCPHAFCAVIGWRVRCGAVRCGRTRKKVRWPHTTHCPTRTCACAHGKSERATAPKIEGAPRRSGAAMDSAGGFGPEIHPPD
jgi:hypothetical protein